MARSLKVRRILARLPPYSLPVSPTLPIRFILRMTAEIAIPPPRPADMDATNTATDVSCVSDTTRTDTGTGADTGSATTPSNKVHYDTQQLATYYARLYPYDFMYDWLSYSCSSSVAQESSELFPKREWSFTLNVQGEEVYMRYQSFANREELSAAVRKRNPQKIDIGAIFTHSPKDHKTVKNFTTVQRELVFDVDLTDYDTVRTCCTGADICRKCWKFMNMAVKVMDCGLKEDFGFQYVSWFYSGRRGVHAWISDESARMLSNEGRTAVAHYFEVACETDNNKNALKLTSPMHPMLSRAFEILEPMFIASIIPAEGQGILASEEKWNTLLQSLLPAGENIVANLTKKWKSDESTPLEKWEDLKRQIGIITGKGKGTKGKSAQFLKADDRERLDMWPYETVFKYTYPRLDINVSTHQNHLLKSPFCIHPKTGRVCVPIDADNIDCFDPFSVPTLPQILTELDEFEKKHVDQKEESKKSLKDWQKTSLNPSFQLFENQLRSMQSQLRRNNRDAKEAEAAMLGDF